MIEVAIDFYNDNLNNGDPKVSDTVFIEAIRFAHIYQCFTITFDLNMTNIVYSFYRSLQIVERYNLILTTQPSIELSMQERGVIDFLLQEYSRNE